MSRLVTLAACRVVERKVKRVLTQAARPDSRGRRLEARKGNGNRSSERRRQHERRLCACSEGGGRRTHNARKGRRRGCVQEREGADVELLANAHPHAVRCTCSHKRRASTGTLYVTTTAHLLLALRNPSHILSPTSHEFPAVGLLLHLRRGPRPTCNHRPHGPPSAAGTWISPAIAPVSSSS